MIEYGLRRWVIVLGILCAPLMETIDSSIVNVALPTLEGSLGATLEEAAWVITGYLVANVIVIPLTPWLQSRFGRRQYFAATTIGFTVASMLCGFSTSIEQLILMRVLQGLFGGGLVATAQSALRDTFPIEEVGASQGAFAFVVVVGPIIAPMLGGAIVDGLSWQWIFFINLIPGLGSILIVGTMLRNPEEPRRSRVDLPGIALLAVGVGSLQYLLDEGQRKDWFGSGDIVVAAIASAAGLTLFVVWELFGTTEPIVDLRVLKYRSVATGTVLSMGIAATVFGTTLVMPQYVQNDLGFTAFGSGELLLFRALPVLFMVPLVGGLVGTGRVDARIAMALGYVLSGASSLLLASRITSDSSFGHFVMPLLVGGVGSALLFIPLFIIVQSTTSAQDAPKASAFITLAFQLGGSITGAVLVTLLDRRSEVHLDTLAGSLTLARPLVRDAIAHGGIGGIYARVLQEAQTLAFADSALLVAMLAFALVPLVALMKRQPRVARPSLE